MTFYDHPYDGSTPGAGGRCARPRPDDSPIRLRGAGARLNRAFFCRSPRAGDPRSEIRAARNSSRRRNSSRNFKPHDKKGAARPRLLADCTLFQTSRQVPGKRYILGARPFTPITPIIRRRPRRRCLFSGLAAEHRGAIPSTSILHEAYDDLPEPTKRRIARPRGYPCLIRASTARASLRPAERKTGAESAAAAGGFHPAGCGRHPENGRKALYLKSGADSNPFVGMEDDEGAPTLVCAAHDPCHAKEVSNIPPTSGRYWATWSSGDKPQASCTRPNPTYDMNEAAVSLYRLMLKGEVPV